MRQVCFAIVGKTKMHMSEMCICEDAECLSDELAMAKEDFPEEDFQIVPLFTRRHLTQRAPDALRAYDMGEVAGVKLTYVKGNVFATPAKRR